MKYIFYCLLLLLFITDFVSAETLQLTNFHKNNNNYENENLIEELNYAENQIFQKNERNESVLTKLEKLEMILFGAIQAGELGYRIGNVYKNCNGYYDYGYGWRNTYPVYGYYPHKAIYNPARYNYIPPVQTLPKHYSLGTTVRILD